MGAAEGPRQHYGITLGVLTVAALAYALSQTLVAPALPAIQQDLGISSTAVSYVLTAYLVSASVATPIVGRLGDMFGKERVLVITLACFGLGSLVAALSSSIETLVAGRVIQGIGAGIFPLSYGIIRDEFPPHRLGTGIGLVSASFGVGGGAGLVLSGPIVDHLSYEWAFWFALPVVAFSVLMTRLFIPESPVRDRVKIDWGGGALLSASLVLLLVAISEGGSRGWLSTEPVGLAIASLAVLAAWTRFEARHSQPLVQMEMMRSRPVWTTNLAALLLGFGLFGSLILIPQLVQTPDESGYGFGATVTEAGLFVLPMSTLMLFSSPLGGWLGDRVGAKLPFAIGTAVATLGLVVLAALHDHRWAIYAGTCLFGFGLGFSLASAANVIVVAVDQRLTGVATGINTIMRTIGGAIGGQVGAAIIASGVTAQGFPTPSSFTIAFIAFAAAVGLAFVSTLLIPGSLVRRAASPLPTLEARPASELAGPS